jgi:hypothetical protein
MKMDKNTKRLITIATIAFIAFAAIAYATYVLWTATITWTPLKKQFVVKDEAGNVLPTPYPINLGVIEVPTTKTFKFYIVNDGNVPITINVVEVTEVGCSGTWNAESFNIGVGESAEAVLTLEISDSGSYQFNFELAP